MTGQKLKDATIALLALDEAGVLRPHDLGGMGRELMKYLLAEIIRLGVSTASIESPTICDCGVPLGDGLPWCTECNEARLAFTDRRIKNIRQR